jgi:hypothetical protein
VRVPMRSIGADRPVVVKKSRNGDGAKGFGCLSSFLDFLVDKKLLTGFQNRDM